MKIKELAANVFFRIHPLSQHLIRRTYEKNLAIVLNYHRLCDYEDPFSPALPVSVFREQMHWLAENFTPVTVEELAERRHRGLSIGGLAAVTFDDGYLDNYQFAFPILRALGIPATFYVTTGFLDGSLPWFERIHLSLRHTSKKQARLRLNGQEYDLSLKNSKERLRAVAFVKDKLKRIPMTHLPYYLTEMEERLAVDVGRYGSNRIMNWEHVRELAAAGMEIGSHTVNHPILSRIGEKEMRFEIAESKALLESKLRQPVTSFCYPNGKRGDFSARAKKIVQEAAYKSAVTTEVGYLTAETDCFEIPRFYTSIQNTATFSLKILLGRN